MTNGNDPMNAFQYDDQSIEPGLTKREYFAAMAMQGLVSNTYSSHDAFYARDAVQLADALIFELNKIEP